VQLKSVSHGLETRLVFGFVMQAFVIQVMFVNVYATGLDTKQITNDRNKDLTH
jgi:hypothetical protein